MPSPRHGYLNIASHSAHSAHRDAELDDAFASDNDDDNDDDTPPTTRLITRATPADQATPTHQQHVPGAYDFERDYDYPPPGSPPRPSSRALPNDYGNTNGLLPAAPIHQSLPQPSFFRRAVGALLPTHYSRVSTSDPSHPTRVVGGGTDNDGVFANVMAKPQVARVIRTGNGEVHYAPEDSQKEVPPSYAEVQADAVPPYWENVVHAPPNPSGSDIIVDDLPAGSVFIFIVNATVSFFFQFVGFFLTYLLHTSHAAKYGSRAGLGLTLIQYGLYSRVIASQENPAPPVDADSMAAFMDAQNATDALITQTHTAPMPDDTTGLGVTSRDWLAFLFMTLGWFLFISSIIGFWRVKRWESSVRSSQSQTPVTAEAIERDRLVRRNLENVFGIPTPTPSEEGGIRYDEHGNVVVIPDREALAEARLARDLRAAGLI
ncbi:hypothetical protein AX17_007389 [Amanita inopinata Kibby_2008]|nr:hypothetical protein AX17_007389 [Amanita inopinata Kibby_2008]